MKYAKMTGSVLTGMALVCSLAVHAEPQFHYTIGTGAGSGIPGKLVLIAVDFTVNEISAGGVTEEVPEWSEEAIMAVKRGVANYYRGNVAFNIVLLPEVSNTEQEVIEEHVALYQVVASTARALIAHGGKAWQHKASRFDYTLGDGLAFLAERSGADAGLIVIGAQSVSSAGRSALSIFSVVTGALTGVYMPMTGGGTFLTAGIVDFRTGDVLWFNFDNKFKAGRDIRDSVIAANAVKELLDAEL